MAKGLLDFRIKTYFSQKLLVRDQQFETKFHMKAYGCMNELVHMSKVAIMPLYGKNL